MKNFSDISDTDISIMLVNSNGFLKNVPHVFRILEPISPVPFSALAAYRACAFLTSAVFV